MMPPSQFQPNPPNQIPPTATGPAPDNQRFIPVSNTIDMVTSEHVDIPDNPYDAGNQQVLNPPSTFTLGPGQAGSIESNRGTL
jgi:hypothetical protein